MALAHCILGKFLGVVCHCFPPPLDVPTFAACCKSTTWDRRLYFPSEGRRAEDFFRPKNPTDSAGFEPANFGTKGHHATPRPHKPLICLKDCQLLDMVHIQEQNKIPLSRLSESSSIQQPPISDTALYNGRFPGFALLCFR